LPFVYPAGIRYASPETLSSHASTAAMPAALTADVFIPDMEINRAESFRVTDKLKNGKRQDIRQA